MLTEGAPTFPTCGAFIDERGIYENPEPLHYEKTVESNFIPDLESYQMVKHVYEQFGLVDTRAIPAFDEKRNFILDNRMEW